MSSLISRARTQCLSAWGSWRSSRATPASPARGRERGMEPPRAQGPRTRRCLPPFVQHARRDGRRSLGRSSGNQDRPHCCGCRLRRGDQPGCRRGANRGCHRLRAFAALRNQVTLNKGVVEQSNFDDYEPTRIREMPKVEVHIMKSTAAPSGIGEPGCATAGAGDRQRDLRSDRKTAKVTSIRPQSTRVRSTDYAPGRQRRRLARLVRCR
jgi:hypothetical protein